MVLQMLADSTNPCVISFAFPQGAWEYVKIVKIFAVWRTWRDSGIQRTSVNEDDRLWPAKRIDVAKGYRLYI